MNFFRTSASETAWQDSRSWKEEARNLVKTVKELSEFFEPTPEERVAIEAPEIKLKFKATRHYLSLIDPSNPEDPLRKMAVPSMRELESLPHDESDPLAEGEYSPVRGFIRRYEDRAVLLASSVCPLNCRFCNRRRLVAEVPAFISEDAVEQAAQFTEKRREIKEIIISGGEFLMLDDNKALKIIESFRRINHIGVIRIASRAIVTLPSRFTKETINELKDLRPICVQSHINHPRELSPQTLEAIDRLVCAGLPVNNQTVLLKGVNDEAKVVLELNRGLVEAGARPYYLFQCDQARGNGHFRTPLETGIGIIESLQSKTSGLLLPHYAVDLTGGGGKVHLAPQRKLAEDKESVTLKNFEGKHIKFFKP